MITAEIIAFLSEKNIILSVYGEQLKVTAPKHILTPEISALIRENKRELIAHLSGNHRSRQETAPSGREYALQDGTILTISDEDFKNMVEIFRMLLIINVRKANNKKE